MTEPALVIPFERLRMANVDEVGGKNASLGEMIGQLGDAGIRVPGGFATTAAAFREFLVHSDLAGKIASRLAHLDVDDVTALAKAGAEIRRWVVESPFQPALARAIASAYEALATGAGDVSFAVRSSATAEDLPDASFAGQQETFLNIKGLDNVLHAVKEVYASLYNDRAIAYRVHKGFAQADIALSAGVQRMVRSDTGAAGVMFTMDTESGFDKVVLITSSYGLGESVVQGAVNPDEFYVYKPNVTAGRPAILRKSVGTKTQKMVFAEGHSAGKSTRVVEVPAAERLRFSITDAEVEELARYALIIEQHYARPMDIEWGRDGSDGKLYILQARPETVKSQERGNDMRRYRLKARSAVLASGRAIGQKIGKGPVRLVKSAAEMDRVQPGDVLVTDMTDPDWEPVMKRAGAIVTNRGGRTCHAAIIARELGIPAVVGCTDATQVLRDGMQVTVSCAEGDTGHVYDGLLDVEIVEVALDKMPPCPTKIMMNVGNPELAFEFQRLPNEGVGLARLEFIINRNVGIHPKALLELSSQPAPLKREIEERIAGYSSPTEYYVSKIAEGVATIAAAFFPKKVIVRLSDFKSNEYLNLLGGDRYEPHEENPMLGFRGASRYISPDFYDCFALECLRDEARARRHGADQRGADGPVRAHARRSREGERAARAERIASRRQRIVGDHDVRDPVECVAGGSFPRALRRLLDRLERHDAADARPRPRFRRRDRRDIRRARRRREDHAVDGDRSMQEEELLRRHLRAGTFRSSGSRAVAGRSGDREHFAESGHGGGDLAAARRPARALTLGLARARFGIRLATTFVR